MRAPVLKAVPIALTVSAGLVRALPLSVAALVVTTATAHAEQPMHQVRYTVTTAQPFYAEIYYRDTDPPTFADYSHDPYLYSPKVEADVGPGAPWVFDALLADPSQWAMVTATGETSTATPMFHCELAVDGVVVASNDGPKGALCSIRPW